MARGSRNKGRQEGRQYFDRNPDLGGDPVRKLMRDALIEAADAQIRDYPPSKAAFERLIGEGIDEYDARMFIANLLSRMTCHVLSNDEPFDDELFQSWLDRLPELPDDSEE